MFGDSNSGREGSKTSDIFSEELFRWKSSCFACLGIRTRDVRAVRPVIFFLKSCFVGRAFVWGIRTRDVGKSMHRGSRRPWRRGKGGFKCRPHSRLRILSLLEKMKKAYGRMMASFVSLGESAFGFNSFARSKRRSYVYPSAPVRRPCYGESNSFYAEAIADCIEFIKLSSSRQDGVR